MSRKNALPSTPRHVAIYDEDWEFLLREYGPGSKSNFGVSNAIRAIVHAKIQQLKAKANEEYDRIRNDLTGEAKQAGSDEYE